MSVEFQNAVNAPTSLDVKFFQEVLENALLETNVVIKKVSFEMGSSGGDNYCSQIYRVRLAFQRDSKPLESLSVIVKSVSVTEATKFLEDLKVFLKERIFYYSMLPRMEILLDKVKLGAKLYYDHKEPINTLVFEDLSASGYAMANRETGLDLDHALMVMRKLGQFHGVSMILHEKDPDCMRSFHSGILATESVNGSDLYETLFGTNIQYVIKLISKWQGFESIAAKIKTYAANFKQNLNRTQFPIEGELKVLNHGDLWVNNILFKYSGDNRAQVDDVLFVDLQLSVYGSPGFDLNYFLYTSLQLAVLKEKREELLRTYHTAMCGLLKTHRCKNIPTFDDILTEVRRRELYGFFALYGIFPGLAMDRTQSQDNTIDKFMDADYANRKREIMFSSKRLQDTLRYTLKRFDDLGVLD